MFTREQWKGDFADCCKPGEEISEELYWNFLDATYPIGLNPQSKCAAFKSENRTTMCCVRTVGCTHGMQHSERTTESTIISGFLQKEGRTMRMCRFEEYEYARIKKNQQEE